MSKLINNPELEASSESINYALTRPIEAQNLVLIGQLAARLIRRGDRIEDYVVTAAMNAPTDAPLIALLPYIDWNRGHQHRLIEAADNGRLDLVEVLLPYSDPTLLDDAALRWAAQQGHTDIVRRLAPLSDGSLRSNSALAEAIDFERWDCVEVLVPYSDMNNIGRFSEDVQTRLRSIIEHSSLQTDTPFKVLAPKTRRI